ncbi:hypothetical protein [Roseovarius sp. E0-M6]|uniref:hypothetical protein n=1 Tax=Roseovarius sp. E0-M6 TaxID=3127118 RepID=UPI00300FF70C
MTKRKEDGEAVARLYGDDRYQVIGWVYLWNTSELSILWIGGNRTTKLVDPPLSRGILAKAKVVTPDAVIDLLDALTAIGRDGAR